MSKKRIAPAQVNHRPNSVMKKIKQNIPINFGEAGTNMSEVQGKTKVQGETKIQGETKGETELHAELLPIEKNIIKAFAGRSFNRFQMQMPFNESSIIFLASNVRDDSSFWTNCLIELVNHDLLMARDDTTPYKSIFYPGVKTLKGIFTDGLVTLPDILNYTGKLGRSETPTNCCLRIINGSTVVTCKKKKKFTGLNELIDSFRLSEKGRYYTTEKKAQSFTEIQWVCPIVPEGSIVVWHGFHTTKGDVGSITPKATMFLDYAEKEVLNTAEMVHYKDIIRSQPFDPGSGTLNARSCRPTIEFNAAKEIPQSVVLPNTEITGGDDESTEIGKIYVDRNTILRQGYGVIVPTITSGNYDDDIAEYNENENDNDGRFPWFMTTDEMNNIKKLQQECKQEYERFLSYYVFEREIRFLTFWLLTYGKYGGKKQELLQELWDLMKGEIDLFDSTTRKFKKDLKEAARQFYIAAGGSKPGDSEEMNDEKLSQEIAIRKKYNTKIKKEKGVKLSREQQTLINMSEELVQFQFNSWKRLSTTACLLDISARSGSLTWKKQKLCWYGMFGGHDPSVLSGKKKVVPAGQASAQIFNDNYFMYWRENMGPQGPKKVKGGPTDPAMCVGRTKQDVINFIEKKVNDGAAAHMHKRNAQGGGKLIAGDSGMGGATTYTAGQAHLELQTGSFGSTLAATFYNDPIVVLERFRVKTHASWGKGHVDHNVQSRPPGINRLYCGEEDTVSPMDMDDDMEEPDSEDMEDDDMEDDDMEEPYMEDNTEEGRTGKKRKQGERLTDSFFRQFIL
tara:strand:+ start:422 stop:2797 length:2376 start_codon:yes stop_codon:yes gene_type:complete